MNFKIIVNDKIARPDVDAPILVCGNSDYVIDFVFDEEWEEYNIKNAIFTFNRGGQKKAIEVVFTGTKCQVPILSGINEVWIGVYAGELQTTTPAKFNCQKSAVCDVAKIEDPPRDVYNQLTEILKDNFPLEAGIKAKEAADYAYDQIGEARELLDTEVDKMHDDLERKADKQTVVDMVEGVVVWENPDPSVEFPEQEIAVDLTEYSRFVVVYKRGGTNEHPNGCSTIEVCDKNLSFVISVATRGGNVDYRTVTISDTAISFGDVKYNGVYYNTELVPLKVVAYKYFIEGEFEEEAQGNYFKLSSELGSVNLGKGVERLYLYTNEGIEVGLDYTIIANMTGEFGERQHLSMNGKVISVGVEDDVNNPRIGTPYVDVNNFENVARWLTYRGYNDSAIFFPLRGDLGTEVLSINAHSEGTDTQAVGAASHAENIRTVAGNDYTHAEGYEAKAFGFASHAEGHSSEAYGAMAHAEGWSYARAEYAHTEGYNTTASENAKHSHVEGDTNTVEAPAAHAEGKDNKASGEAAHVEGKENEAKGEAAHAEGLDVTAEKKAAHAEGWQSKASGIAAHAEGYSEATGDYAHAEGYDTHAHHYAAHASGYCTKTSRNHQTVIGKFNEDDPDAIFIVGCGSGEHDRRNAFVIKEDGTAYLFGKKVLTQ